MPRTNKLTPDDINTLIEAFSQVFVTKTRLSSKTNTLLRKLKRQK
jgi:hypothetical protein